jgi:hypothetical protein
MVGLLPVQLPEAVQLVALVVDHINVVEPPLLTVSGLAVMVTVGCTLGAVIATLAVAAPMPPRPVHVSVKAEAIVILVIISLPLVPRGPLQLPEAAQLLALFEAQVSVLAPPLTTLVGVAAIVTVGAGTMATLAEAAPIPPGPVHVSV